MSNEIERKFLVKTMPNLEVFKPKHYERYFLKRNNFEEVRITRVDEKYYYEQKTIVSALERTGEKKEISPDEFRQLIPSNAKPICRVRYDIQENPLNSLQIYEGEFQGLVRAETEFSTLEDARAFIPLPWMGREITGDKFARDSTLIELSSKELKQMLDSLSHN